MGTLRASGMDSDTNAAKGQVFRVNPWPNPHPMVVVKPRCLSQLERPLGEQVSTNTGPRSAA